MDTLNHFPAWQQRLVDLPEPECHVLLDAMAARHGWSFALWTRADAVAALGTSPTRPARVLGPGEWERLTATSAWAELPREAYAAVDAAQLIEAATKQAGLACNNCDQPLYQPPTITGRLCHGCRRGPHGQAVEVDPATGGLWYLHGPQLYYAHPAPDDQRPTITDAIAYDPATATVDQQHRADAIRHRLHTHARISFRAIIENLRTHGIPAAIVDLYRSDCIGVGQPTGQGDSATYPVYIGPGAGYNAQLGCYGLASDLYIALTGTGDNTESEGDSYYTVTPGDTPVTIAAKAVQALTQYHAAA